MLVVDDEPAIGDVVCRYLGAPAMRRHGAHRGEALRQAERPDLVVLDLMLPDLDGLEDAPPAP